MSNNKALKILYDKYWVPSKGWQKNKASEEDFEYARNAGVMFDDISSEHNSTVNKAIEQCQSLNRSKITDAFVSSLSSRRLDLRSALSSYACGQTLPQHNFQQQENNSASKSCVICLEPSKDKTVDLNVLNFERNKFGGVRHIQPGYIWLDLMLFSREEISQPKKEDIEILKNILHSLRNLSIGKLSDAEKSFKTSLKSNKNERVGIVAALGYCGILKVPEYNSFHESYIPYYKRKYSNHAKSDWPFPSDLWVPKYGLNLESIDYWFGSYVS